jgi:hypothetical protein
MQSFPDDFHINRTNYILNYEETELTKNLRKNDIQ